MLKDFELLKDAHSYEENGKTIFEISGRIGWCDGGVAKANPINKKFINEISKKLNKKVLAKSYSLERVTGPILNECYPKIREQYSDIEYYLQLIDSIGAPMGMYLNDEKLMSFQKKLIEEIAKLSISDKKFLYSKMSKSKIDKCLESIKFAEDGYFEYQFDLLKLNSILQEIAEKDYNIIIVY